MDVTADLVAPCPPEELFRWVDDLGHYPDWLDIVPRAVPAASHPDDVGPAWQVTLRGRLGPLARTKRLRMVRTLHEPPVAVRFERVEHDGRAHAPWVLTARIVGDDLDGLVSSTLTVDLHYGGSLGGPPVHALLEDAITSSRPRLLERLGAHR